VLRLSSLLWRLRRIIAIETDLLQIQAEILRDRRSRPRFPIKRRGSSRAPPKEIALQRPRVIAARVDLLFPAAREISTAARWSGLVDTMLLCGSKPLRPCFAWLDPTPVRWFAELAGAAAVPHPPSRPPLEW
jgi:hypothetical protein